MIINDGIFIDKNSYKQIYNILIIKVIEEYQSKYSGILVAHEAEELIWNEYVKLNYQCKLNYMKDITGKLDRHKVCACYMYAIMKANVLGCCLADSDNERFYLALNENLAITVGMSLLRAFIISSIKNSDYNDSEKTTLVELIDDGIKFPECNHGTYKDNFVAELHNTAKEHNYNILSLANVLYLLEIYTLKVDAVHKQNV